MKVRYVGVSFGVDSWTNGKIDEGLEDESELGVLRGSDDNEEE